LLARLLLAWLLLALPVVATRLRRAAAAGAAWLLLFALARRLSLLWRFLEATHGHSLVADVADSPLFDRVAAANNACLFLAEYSHRKSP